MASQIAHVVYGRKVFDRLSGVLWPEFLVGTLLPDIRYIAHIDRRLLHERNTSEGEVPRDDSFGAGMYVHSLVDKKRESFIEKEGIYNILHDNGYLPVSLKLVEDEILFGKYREWDEVIKILNNYYPGEYEFGLEKKVVERWHNLLKKYFTVGPGLEIWKELVLALGFSRELCEEVLRDIEMIKRNKKAMDIIERTFEAI